MIGDADGHTEEEVDLSVDNPYIEKYCRLLGRLKPIKGYWGISLTPEKIKISFEQGQMTKEEYDFLDRVMFFEDHMCDKKNDLRTFFPTDDEYNYAGEFFDGIKADAEYSFLSLVGYSLHYIDEQNRLHQTEFI